MEIERPSTLESVDELQRTVESFALREGLDADAAYFFALAAREALTNAVRHGNREDPNLPVRLEMMRRADSLVVSVRDRGAGFDPAHVPDPLSRANLDRGSGRGIFLMRQFCDRVDFEPSSSGGTTVHLEKRIR